MDPLAAVYITEERLVVSPAASVEVAAAAMDAQERAGLRTADFVILAVPPGTASADLVEAIEAVARRTPAYARPATEPPQPVAD